MFIHIVLPLLIGALLGISITAWIIPIGTFQKDGVPARQIGFRILLSGALIYLAIWISDYIHHIPIAVCR